MLMDMIFRHFLTLIALVLAGRLVHANDLKLLYELALTRDTTLQVAHFQRDVSIEVRPQALASLLPQLSASASATRERAGYDSSQISSTQSAGCTLSADGSKFSSRGRRSHLQRSGAESAAASRTGVLRNSIGVRPSRDQPQRARSVRFAAQSGHGAPANGCRAAQRCGPSAGFL